MAPPSGLFVIARLDGDAVGCGGLKRVDKATGEKARLDRAVRRGLGIARRCCERSNLQPAKKGEDAAPGHQPSADRSPLLYRSEGYQEIARFNDNPYADHWFEKRL